MIRTWRFEANVSLDEQRIVFNTLICCLKAVDYSDATESRPFGLAFHWREMCWLKRKGQDCIDCKPRLQCESVSIYGYLYLET